MRLVTSKNLACLYRMPLRQLQGRQFGHWMFQAPQNLLLEQAVHPLSQITALIPEATVVNVSLGDRLTLPPDKALLLEVDVAFRNEAASAQFHFALGADFPHWELIASCTDGIVHADITNNRCYTRQRTRWLEPTDQLLSGLGSAFGLAASSWSNAASYGLSMLRLRSRSDAYFMSMKNAIADFHQALDRAQRPTSDAVFATGLVDLCEQIANAGGAHGKASLRGAEIAAKPLAAAAADGHDVLLIGGTGFIGRAVMKKLLKDDLKIAVLARNITNLPPIFSKPNVTLIRGSFTDEEAVSRAMNGCRQVVHLAHGMGSGVDLAATMRAGTRLIAEQCLASGVERLVYVSSIAALYLGDENDTVTAATPPDPEHDLRADYSKAKALCDLDLFTMHAKQGLPVVILRPGLVVGEGTSPFHSGLGFYNNDQHCMGWSEGRNPLPFVLVEDVGTAIVSALNAEGIGGKAYNIVGDVRPNARRYLESLADALGRPLHYHGQSAGRLYAVDWAKWILKRLGGRRAPAPSLRDFRSRGLFATFDCSVEKRDLNWQPNADEAYFQARAVDMFRPRQTPPKGDVVPLPRRPEATEADGENRHAAQAR